MLYVSLLKVKFRRAKCVKCVKNDLHRQVWDGHDCSASQNVDVS